MPIIHRVIQHAMNGLNSLKIRLRPILRQEQTSLWWLMVCKALFWGNGVMHRVWHARYRTKSKNGLQRLRDGRAESVFVFANGPSLNDLDFSKVKILVDSHEFDLIAVNSFASKGITKYNITPTAAVFADPFHYIGVNGEGLSNQALEDIRVINERAIPAIVPSRYFINSHFADSIPYCGAYNPYGNNVSNLQQPLGHYGITAFVALSLALDLEYKKIYICGYDNSYFKDFEVDCENRKYFNDLHFYDSADSEKRYLDVERYGPTSHIFQDFARHFAYLEKIHNLKPQEVGIYNIARKTYTDAFARCFDLDVYKE